MSPRLDDTYPLVPHSPACDVAIQRGHRGQPDWSTLRRGEFCSNRRDQGRHRSEGTPSSPRLSDSSTIGYDHRLGANRRKIRAPNDRARGFGRRHFNPAAKTSHRQLAVKNAPRHHPRGVVKSLQLLEDLVANIERSVGAVSRRPPTNTQ